MSLVCDAQNAPEVDSPKHFLKQFVFDEGAIWSSPFRVQKRDMKWLVPAVGTTAVLLETDRHVADRIRQTDDLSKPSHVISAAGSGLPMVLAPLTVFTFGKVLHNRKASQTGETGLQAVLHAGLVAQTLKVVSERQRPYDAQGRGLFWRGGSSFPSGHAMTTWAFATVVAKQNSQNKWLRFAAYGTATAVSLSRIGGLNHFPSDVLVGSSAGYLIGRFVASHQH